MKNCIYIGPPRSYYSFGRTGQLEEGGMGTHMWFYPDVDEKTERIGCPCAKEYLYIPSEMPVGLPNRHTPSLSRVRVLDQDARLKQAREAAAPPRLYFLPSNNCVSKANGVTRPPEKAPHKPRPCKLSELR